jgi:glycosyltransferase involved in cell wall biosynthesis
VNQALLLTPPRGRGGGIERVANSVTKCWETRGTLHHVDLAGPSGGSKLAFAIRTLVAAVRRRPDVVLCLHLGLLPVAFFAAALGGSRLVLMGMGREVWAPMPPWQARLVRRCSRLLAISPFTAEWLARRAGLPLGAVEVVMLPVGERFADLARRGGIRPAAGARDLGLLTVSRIARECRYKGHFLVADAVAELMRRGRRVRWVVVGDGDDMPNLRRRCADIGIEAYVELVGHVTDAELEDRYRAADVFVLPSVADPTSIPPVGEGFGLVYAEAAAFGLPSIASARGGGSAAFVVDGQTGIAVIPGSVTDLADALTRLDEDRQLGVQLGDEARQCVLARHLPEHFCRTFQAALDVPCAGSMRSAPKQRTGTTR